MRRKRINNAIRDIFIENHEIEDIDELTIEIKKRVKTRTKNSTIEEYINDYFYDNIPSHYCLLDDNTLASSKTLFPDTKFKIVLTEEEFGLKELIVGHRMIPYGNIFVDTKDIVLRNKAGNNIDMKIERRYIKDLYVYISLHFEVIENLNIDIDKGIVDIPVFQLEKWMEEEQFTKSDQILCSIIDYDKGIYQIEKISKHELNTNSFLIKNKDNQLENAILEMLDDYKILPVNTCLFYAFILCKQETIDNPGTSIGTFLVNSENIDFSEENGTAFLNKKGFDLYQDTWDEVLDGNLPEPGVAKDLEGILAEIGSSYTEDFIRSKMIEQLLKTNSIDTDEILSIIHKIPYPFANSKQANNFSKAFSKAEKEITKKWKNKKITKDKIMLLSEALNLKIEFVEFLRKLDDNMSDPHSFDTSLLMPLQKFDMLADKLLNFFSNMSPTDFKKNKEILKLIPQIRKFKKEFFEVSNDVIQKV